MSENDLRGFAHHIGHLSNLNISHFWNQSYQLKHWHSRGKENVLKKNSEKIRIINCFSQCHTNIILKIILNIIERSFSNTLLANYHLPQNLIFFPIKEIIIPAAPYLKTFHCGQVPLLGWRVRLTWICPIIFTFSTKKEKIFLLWASSLLRGSIQNKVVQGHFIKSPILQEICI